MNRRISPIAQRHESPANRPGTQRGVFESRRPLCGYRSWVIVNTQGATIRQCAIAECHTTDQTVEALWRWLDQVDPVTTLSLVPGVLHDPMTHRVVSRHPSRLELV